METATLVATRRKQLGSKHTRRLRREGKLPAVIYGHGEDAETVAIDRHEIEVALLRHSRVLDLDIEGSKQQFLIKAVQYDHLGTNPLHLDLMRVRADERVQVHVEVELKGVPKGAHDGGILSQLINDLEIECPVVSIPATIRGNISELKIDDTLKVKDLEIPDGVTVMIDMEDPVAIIRPPVTESETEVEEEGAETESSAEPEIIGRKKEDGEEAS